MNWLRRLARRLRPVDTSAHKSISTELRREQILRRREQQRTEKLAQLLEDYAAQDRMLRR